MSHVPLPFIHSPPPQSSSFLHLHFGRLVGKCRGMALKREFHPSLLYWNSLRDFQRNSLKAHTSYRHTCVCVCVCVYMDTVHSTCIRQRQAVDNHSPLAFLRAWPDFIRPPDKTSFPDALWGIFVVTDRSFPQLVGPVWCNLHLRGTYQST